MCVDMCIDGSRYAAPGKFRPATLSDASANYVSHASAPVSSILK